jgi:hypothetical protein
VPTKTVLKVGFLERDFERDHLAFRQATRQKWAKKYTVLWPKKRPKSVKSKQ